MTTTHYNWVLAHCSDREGAISLLRSHRPYWEMIPSLRRPEESLITIPLPVVKVRLPASGTRPGGSMVNLHTQRLACDLGLLMCDPEWKVKLGVEILVFIHQTEEDFADLLGRWRQDQIALSHEYEWLMPQGEQHVFSEKAEQILPLFVIFPDTPERIKRGLNGARLPFIMPVHPLKDARNTPLLSAETP